MRKFLLFICLLSLPLMLSAQSTTVSGQITDAGSQSWNNGTFTISFVPSVANPVGPYSWSGGILSQTIIGNMSGTGSYSVSVPSNSAISPGGSQWRLQFCPQASAQCFTVGPITIFGATQTVNATPPTILINLQTAIPPVSAYSTTEVTGTVLGSQFYLIGTGLQICTAVSGNSCTTWTGTSGGGSPGGNTGDTQCKSGGGTFTACNVNPIILYVSPTGSDTNSGKTWDTAKLTIGGACTVVGNSGCTAGAATIYTTGTNYFLPSGTVPGINMRVLSNFSSLVGGPAIDSGPVPSGIDIRAYGGRPLFAPPNTITCTTNGTSTISCPGGISDFQQGDDLVIGAAGGATSQTTPAAPTLTMVGATGTNSVSYECVGLGQAWDMTAASPAATIATVPTVFGQAGVNISSATWASNTVTVNTSSAMPFSTGTFHAMMSNLVSGGVQIGGIRQVTMVSSTQLTYTLTGSGTVTTTNAAILFVNGFDVTAQETAGSNQVVLTTDSTHNLQQQLANSHPTEMYVDGISFPGEPVTGYANGLFTITSVTSNTITYQTPYTATITQAGVASSALSSAAVAAMSVLVYPEVQVVCPQSASGLPSTGGAQYVVYANYGSGYAPIGLTIWQHSMFYDRGPAFTQANFTPPPSMNLPATPPASAVPKIYEGKINSISGTTLTMDRAATQSLSGVTAYHSNGISLQNAVNTACLRFDGLANNSNFYSVLIPAPTSGQQAYYFNAPVDLDGGAGGCNRVSVQDSANIVANGTITSSTAALVDWKKPAAGFTTISAGAVSGGAVSWTGLASPMIGTGFSSAWDVESTLFTVSSNGQNAVVNLAAGSHFDNVGFFGGTNLLSAIPLIIGGSGFVFRMRDVTFGTIPNPFAPATQPCGNCGAVMWWPTPTVESIAGPSNWASILWEGTNYGNAEGIRIGNAYVGANQPPEEIQIANVQTFQEPWQPFFRYFGNIGVGNTKLEGIQMDSVINPNVANVGCTSCTNLLVKQLYTAGNNFPWITGTPFNNVFNYIDGTNPQPSNNSELFGPFGQYNTAPTIARGGLVANPAPFDNFNYTGPSLASGWTSLAGYNSFVVSGNQVTTNASNVDFAAFYSKYIPAPDQFAEVTITSTAGQSIIAPFVRYNQTQQRVYICWVFSGTAFITLENTANQANTTLTSGTVTIHIGDIFRLEDIGTNLTCYQNGTAILTVSDSTIATGYPGMWSFGNSNTGDNWSGGNFVAQLNNEQDWSQPQHFIGPVTIGESVPSGIAGALAAGGLYDSLWAVSSGLCTDSTGKAVTTGCAGGNISGLTSGQVAIAGGATSITSSKAIQGTDTSILSSGTISGTAAALCTDANGGATTSGCTGGAISGMTTGQVAIAGSASSITSSKALQGTDSNILTSSTIAAGAGNPLCTDTGSGATTSSCPNISGLTTGQIPVAGSATTLTSSKALQGTDSNILTSGTVAAGANNALCTDANSGATTSGCNGTVYNTQSSTTNTNIAATNMVASTSALHSYQFSWTISLTAVGVGCSSSTTVNMNAVFTDPNTSSSITELLGTITIAAGGNGTVGFVAQGTDNILAKTTTAVQYSTTGYTAGTGCTTNPTYQVSPTLVQLW